MATKKGAIAIANLVRDNMDENYLNKIDIVTDTTTIESFANPILADFNIKNDFLNVLINKIVKEQVFNKLFSNPLNMLEGDEIPLGQVVQDIYINPTEGRNFDVNDFAGLLKRYDADIKVQYIPLNSDRQYPITVSDVQLRKAFMSWDAFGRFVEGLTNSLYNGMYIERFNYTKALVGKAFTENKAIIRKVDPVVDDTSAKALIKVLRNYYLNFALPSTEFNAWSKNGGYGYKVNTFTDPEDIVIIVKNEVMTEINVETLAGAFNLDKTDLIGRIIYVDDFTQRDTKGNIIRAADDVIAFIGDKRWFRINQQLSYLDEPFRNANNRTQNWYLNDIRGYNFSCFANGVILSTSEASVPATGITTATTDLNITKGTEKQVAYTITPANTTDELVVTAIENSTGTDISANVTVNIINKNTIELLAKPELTDTSIVVKVSVGTQTTSTTLTVV